MSLVRSGSVVGIESDSVVRDGQDERRPVELRGDDDVFRLAVPCGVRDEFAGDAQDRVEGVVGDARAWQIRFNGQLCRADMRRKGAAAAAAFTCLATVLPS